jgi:ADP-glucose pyrophosphorylase
MDTTSLQSGTLAIVMGGGAGTRLFPLTKDRAKPAVPLAGKYRLVDIPISNCLNSGLRRVYVLSKSWPLNRLRRQLAGTKVPRMPCVKTSATFSRVLTSST